MGLESRVVIWSASSSVSIGYPGVDRRAADSVWRSRADWLSCMVAEYGPRAHLVAAAPFASHFRSTESLTPGSPQSDGEGDERDDGQCATQRHEHAPTGAVTADQLGSAAQHRTNQE